jgi:hypothetical protein
VEWNYLFVHACDQHVIEFEPLYAMERGYAKARLGSVLGLAWFDWKNKHAVISESGPVLLEQSVGSCNEAARRKQSPVGGELPYAATEVFHLLTKG